MISAAAWEKMRPNWPSLCQAFDGSFQIFRNHWRFPRHSNDSISSGAFQKRWHAALEHARTCSYLRTFIGLMTRRWLF